MADEKEKKQDPPPKNIREFFARSGRPLSAGATLEDVVHAFEATGHHVFADPKKVGTGDDAIAAGAKPKK